MAKKPRVQASKAGQSKSGRRESKTVGGVRDGCGDGDAGDECGVRSGRRASLEYLLLAAGVEVRHTHTHTHTHTHKHTHTHTHTHW